MALAATFSPGPGVLLAISTTLALGARLLPLNLTFAACMLVSHVTYVLVAARAGTHLLNGGGMRVLRRFMGALYVLMGAGLLLTKL